MKRVRDVFKRAFLRLRLRRILARCDAVSVLERWSRGERPPSARWLVASGHLTNLLGFAFF